MYYVIGSRSTDGFNTLYVICHVYTMSKFEVHQNKLKELIKLDKIQVKNAYIDDLDDLIIKGWTYKLFDKRESDRGSLCIITHKVDGEHSIYDGISLRGDRYTWTLIDAIDAGIEGKIANAVVRGDKCTFADITETRRDTKFEDHIAKEYSRYVAKSKLLGRNVSFHYEIIDKEVILTNYTGNSNDIILPPFITGINSLAFYLCKTVEKIKLNEGLKFIGESAFMHCGLSKIEIPSTVKLIGIKAFKDNQKDLVTTEGTGFTKHVKFLGDKNKILIL